MLNPASAGGGAGARRHDGRDAHAAPVLRHGQGQRRRPAQLRRRAPTSSARAGSSPARRSATSSPAASARIHADLVGERHGPVVGTDRQHGRRRRADPPVTRRDARRAGPALQHGDQPAARLRATATSWCPSARSRSSAPARGWSSDPDDLGVPPDHVQRMVDEGSVLVPAVRDAPFRSAWSAARPLIGSKDDADSGRELSRTFKTIDHAAEDGVEGFVTITGGKGTTLRGHGGGVRRRGLPQARHRRRLPRRARRSCFPTRRSSRHERLRRATPTTRRFRVHRFKRERDGAACRGARRAGRARAPPCSRRSGGSSSTTTGRSALRHSCFHASCGTCGVRVNGTRATRVRHAARRTVRGAPSPSSPSRTCRCCTMWSSTWRRSSSGSRRPTRRARRASSCPMPPTPDDIEGYVRFEDCIECGLCLSACPGRRDRRHLPRPRRARLRAATARGAARRRPRRASWTGPTRTTPRGDATPRSSAPRPARPTCGPPSASWRCARSCGGRRREQGRRCPSTPRRSRRERPTGAGAGRDPGVEEILRARRERGPGRAQSARHRSAWFDVRQPRARAISRSR